MNTPDATRSYFQDFMPGNICFGCGRDNHFGLQISSYWEGEEALCTWTPTPQYEGWRGLLNGGILATLIDCHTMCTAMAAAHRAEGRDLGTLPEYRYATGTITVKYLQPTPSDVPVTLRARVVEIKGRKTTLTCETWANDQLTATAEVVALRVYDSSTTTSGPFAQ